MAQGKPSRRDVFTTVAAGGSAAPALSSQARHTLNAVRRTASAVQEPVLVLQGSSARSTELAKLLAEELETQLLRVDISGVVSEFIGETEKNLARLLDRAEESGAVLLLDEADALFGKRTEVKDAHDRYANAGISMLLRRIENYPGLVILAGRNQRSIRTAFATLKRPAVELPPLEDQDEDGSGRP